MFGKCRGAFAPSHSIICSFLLFNLIQDIQLVSSNSNVEKFIEEGTRLLAAGQIAEALIQYNLAIEQDEKNYLVFFRRATAHMALGKLKSALNDLDKTLQLNLNFNPARKKRGSILFKSGELDLAAQDYRFLTNSDPDNRAEYDAALAQIHTVQQQLSHAVELQQSLQFSHAVQEISALIELMPQDKSLREMRAKCYLKLGDKHKAINDYRFSVKQTNDNMEGLLQLSILMYEAGEAELSLVEIRECLRLDQDHKECFQHYKKVKKLAGLVTAAQASLNEDRLDKCVENARRVLELEPARPEYVEQMDVFLCKCQIKSSPQAAVEHCGRLISRHPQDLDWLCDRAEAHLNQQDYELAIQDYQQVLGAERNHQRARSGMQRAQKMLKTSQKRDYYKILGVSRSASKAEVLKAYRKLAREYHPDHTRHDKKLAEAKFIDISAAKEVLSDPEKREKFDNGEDPLDPEQQQHQGGHGPFGGFTFTNFNPFGNGGNFEFHFG